MNSIVFVGLYPASPCVILFLDVQIEYITVVIKTLSLEVIEALAVQAQYDASRRYHLIEACKGVMKTMLSEALP